jgi:hypothetical protein
MPATADDSQVFPLRVLAYRLETAVERADSGKPVAWFPINFRCIATHPSGGTWAGSAANYLCIMTLEGEPSVAMAEPSEQETSLLAPASEGKPRHVYFVSNPDDEPSEEEASLLAPASAGFAANPDEEPSEEETSLLPGVPGRGSHSSNVPMTFGEHMGEFHHHLRPVIFGWLLATLACAWRLEPGWYGKMVLAALDGLLVVYPLSAIQLFRFAQTGLQPRERTPVFLAILFGPPIMLGIIGLLLAPLEWLYGNWADGRFRVMMPKSVAVLLVLGFFILEGLIRRNQHIAFPFWRVAFWVVLLLAFITIPALTWSLTLVPFFTGSVLFAIWPQPFAKLLLRAWRRST